MDFFKILKSALGLERVQKEWSDAAREASIESRQKGRYDGLYDLKGNNGGGYSRAVAAGVYRAVNLQDAPKDGTKQASHEAAFRGKDKKECTDAVYYAKQFLKGAGFNFEAKRYPGRTPDMGTVETWVHKSNGAKATLDYGNFNIGDRQLFVEVSHNKSYTHKSEIVSRAAESSQGFVMVSQ